MAKLDGLPPNMSVTTTTPDPRSTLSAALQISSCLDCLSSSFFIDTAVIPPAYQQRAQALPDILVLSHREQQLQYQSKILPQQNSN